MDVPAPHRILLVRLSHLGDVVHAVPLLHALRAAHPDARLAWAVQPEFADLVRPIAGLERVFLFDRRGGLRAWRRLRRELREWRPDWSVDAQGNHKSAAVTWCSGAPVRYGLARKDWQEPFGARRLTHAAPSSYGVHAVHKLTALLERIVPDPELCFDLELDPAERAAGREALASRLGAPRSPDRGREWLLHLGAPQDPRSWPAENFAALAEALAAAGDRVLVLSGPAEAEVGERVRARLTSHEDNRPAPIEHWIGQRGLRLLAATFTAAAARGARVVVGDSGPAHVAAACGAGVDLISGPQDPARTGPWPIAGRPGSPHRVLAVDAGRTAPIEGLSVEAVFNRLREPAPQA